jgi:hypothetical protein
VRDRDFDRLSLRLNAATSRRGLIAAFLSGIIGTALGRLAGEASANTTGDGNLLSSCGDAFCQQPPAQYCINNACCDGNLVCDNYQSGTSTCCAVNQTCQNGQCVPICPSGQTACGSQCCAGTCVGDQCVTGPNPITSSCNPATEVPCGDTCCSINSNQVCFNNQCVTLGASETQLEVSAPPTDIPHPTEPLQVLPQPT